MAGFFDRVGAYIIDLVIISLILSAISMGLPNNAEISSRLTNLETQIVSGEVKSEEVMDEYQDLLYDLQKSTILYSSITVAVNIAYFVIFQCMYNGQTFGKKLLKIKVVSSDDNKAKFLQMFLRYLFIMNIFSGVVNILLLFVLSSSSYMVSYLSVSVIESIFMIISLLFVLYRKDKRGLHDMMAKTKVIKEV